MCSPSSGRVRKNLSPQNECRADRCSGCFYFLRGDFVLGCAGATEGVDAALGRPVLSSGTAFSASRKAASDMPANTLRPARSSSLFLMGCASAAARCLSVSMTAYSSLGIVKLSRTSLGFFAFTAFSTIGCVTAAGLGVATWAIGSVFFWIALAGAFFATVALGWGALATRVGFNAADGAVGFCIGAGVGVGVVAVIELNG